MIKRVCGFLLLSGLALSVSACNGGFAFSYQDGGPRRSSGHVCRRDCHHHYHNGVKLVSLRRHRHTTGCGHVWDGAHWVIVKKSRSQKVHKRNVAVPARRKAAANRAGARARGR